MSEIDYIISYTKKRNKILKYLFLLSGILVFISLFIPSFNKEEDNFNPILKPVSANSSKEFDLNVNNPVLEGLSKNNLPYKIIASVVTRHHSNSYDMNLVNARHELADGYLDIKAEKGMFDEDKKLFTLFKEVVISFNDLILTGEKIDLNLYSNVVSSHEPIEVTFKNSKIKATSFNTDNSNKIMNFQGNVVATFSLNDF